MEKNKSGFTLVEILVALAIIGFLLMLIVSHPTKTDEEQKREFGREISHPEAGQIYKVTAVDSDQNVVIVMPWRYGNDGSVMTDRRLFFKVSSNICEKGTWFVWCKGDQGFILSPPIICNTTNLMSVIEAVK